MVLPAPLATALRRQRSAQISERLAAGSRWVDTDLIFTTPHGSPVDPRNDYRAWRSLLEQAGVRPARLHDARHTAATLLLAQGVPARVAMQILGHSQITLTLGTYSHVVPELAHDAARRMAHVLWAEPDTGETLAATLAATPAKSTRSGTKESTGESLSRDDVVGPVGLEPTTRGLKVRCSAS